MSKITTLNRVTVNGVEHVVHDRTLTPSALKALAQRPNDHELHRVTDAGQVADYDGDAELALSGDDHFLVTDRQEHVALVFINRRPYLFMNPHQTGSSIKERAGIAPDDVLFLNRPGEDEVITNQATVTLHTGQRFHSAPPANYGDASSLGVELAGVEGYALHRQADGWTWLTFADFAVGDAYKPDRAALLIKLPPGFPDAAPDMFWLHPPVSTAAGGQPHGTSCSEFFGKTWQQFSWHLSSGAWVPGVSTLRDFLRCVRARLEKRN